MNPRAETASAPGPADAAGVPQQQAHWRRVSQAVMRAIAVSVEPRANSRLHDSADRRPGLQWNAERGPTASRSRWRGELDSVALRSRFSDRELYARHEPQSAAAKTLYHLLEQCRSEALGARRYIGTAENLAAFVDDCWARARPEAIIRSTNASWVETFALLCRLPIGAPLPRAAREALATTWRHWMNGPQADMVMRLGDLIEDQEAFAVQAQQVIETLQLETPVVAASDPRGGSGHESGNAFPARSDSALRQRASTAPIGVADSLAAAAPSGPDTSSAYSVYSKEYDACVQACDLYESAKLARLRERLDALAQERLPGLSRWSYRLQRKLLAWQRYAWYVDQEEGLLDLTRLSRLVTHPRDPLLFKRQSELQSIATVVTFLVDNSRSMRGTAIATAALCAQMLGRLLDRGGIKTEVLGFTTRTWRGGRPREEWIDAGRPQRPGRLAELLHVIYKHADQSWRSAHASLGAMICDDLLKENVDGEALLWAYERLSRRPEPRKLLVVISDGAPLEESTLQANDAGCLGRHLASVAKAIERQAAVQLIAIGIGHEVRAYYRNAFRLTHIDQLGEVLVTRLIEALDNYTVGLRTRSRTAAAREVRT